MTFRNYLAVTVFFVLGIWGPIDYTWHHWVLIRIGYMLFIPLIFWILVGLVWDWWELSKKLDDTMNLILSLLVFSTLLTLAFIEARSSFHLGNSKWVTTRDGIEAVGYEIVLPGPDWGEVLILGIVAALILWYGIIKRFRNVNPSRQ